MDNPDNDSIKKIRIKKRVGNGVILLIVGAVFFLNVLLIYRAFRHYIFPQNPSYEFPYSATISVSNISNKKDMVAAEEIIQARRDWVASQEYERTRFNTLDLSRGDKIILIFDYEDGFDIDTFANEIAQAADLLFLDSNDNKIFDSADIVSTRYAYQGEPQLYDLHIKLTDVGMQQFLTTVETGNEGENTIRIIFNGSISSDLFTVEVENRDTVVIKGFRNRAAGALMKLIEIKDAPNDLRVELNYVQNKSSNDVNEMVLLRFAEGVSSRFEHYGYFAIYFSFLQALIATSVKKRECFQVNPPEERAAPPSGFLQVLTFFSIFLNGILTIALLLLNLIAVVSTPFNVLLGPFMFMGFGATFGLPFAVLFAMMLSAKYRKSGRVLLSIIVQIAAFFSAVVPIALLII
jgi:hypothetical protein